LPGVAWLAYVAQGRKFDADFEADLRSFFQDFYHLELTGAQLQKLLGA
jgi:pyruvate carboxylase